MTQEKVMIGGKELRQGCVVKNDEGDYFKILAFNENRFSQTNYYTTQEKAEKDNEPSLTNDFDDYALEIISYPILGQDKYGDDVRLFDLVHDACSSHKECNLKVLGFLKAIDDDEIDFFLVEDHSLVGGWGSVEKIYCTLVKQPKTLIGKTATVTIDGKSYKVEVKEEVR